MNLERFIGLDYHPSDYRQFHSYSHEYEMGQQVWYGDLHSGYIDWDETVYVELEEASGSDYSGTTFNYSNYLILAEDEEWEPLREEGIVVDSYGAMGTYAIFLALNVETENKALLIQLVGILEDLSEYLIISEEHLSNLEMELEDEDWHSCTMREFWSALQTLFEENDYMTDVIDNLSDDDVWNIWHAAVCKSNQYPQFEYLQIYWDILRIVEVIDKEFVLEIIEYEN